MSIPSAAKSARSASMKIRPSSSNVTLSELLAPVSSAGSRTTASGTGAAKFSISTL